MVNTNTLVSIPINVNNDKNALMQGGANRDFKCQTYDVMRSMKLSINPLHFGRNWIERKHEPWASSMFCGLTSRWTMNRLWMKSSARANWRVNSFDSSSEKVARSPTQFLKMSPFIALKNCNFDGGWHLFLYICSVHAQTKPIIINRLLISLEKLLQK